VRDILKWSLTLVPVLLAGAARHAVSQSPSAMVTGPSQAAKVSSPGRQSQSSAVQFEQRTANATAPNSSNVIQDSVNVQGSYTGSVPASGVLGSTLRLTLEDALARGLRANLAAISQSAVVEQSRGELTVARSALLPQLNAGISEEFERLNLRTQGVEIQSFPEAVKFNYYDARVRLQQSIFDLVRIRNLHGATETLQANMRQARDARDLIVLAVGGTYLQLLSTVAREQAVAAQEHVAEAIATQADDRLSAGLATRVDAMRARVQAQIEAQRRRSLEADVETQKLKLARMVGLAPGQAFDPTDVYVYAPETMYTQEEAIRRALDQRNDLRATQSELRAAEDAVHAAHAERYPNLALDATFGAAGITPSHESTGTYTVTGTMTVPIFEGGRIHGDVQQAEATVKERKAEYENLRAQVDQDVRQAFIDLRSAADQVAVAKDNVDLAHASLEQSRDRFSAGVTDTVEVVQAEQAVVQADDDEIMAIYEHNLAKVALARAMGDAEAALPQLLERK
jgi:outer membrane protein TolC